VTPPETGQSLYQVDNIQLNASEIMKHEVNISIKHVLEEK